MSNSKNKTEKVAPATEPPKPAPRKRAAPKKTQRVAEVEPDATTDTVAPVHTTVTVSEPEQQVLPKQMPIDNFPPLLQAQPEHITIPQVEEEVKERAVGVWGKVKELWNKYAWILILALFATVIVFIWIEVNRGKSNRTAKQTQQTELQQQDARNKLSLSETNLSAILRKRQADTLEVQAMSAIRAAVDSLKKYDELMTKRNNVLKLQEYELQNKINSASDDDLRRLGSELSGRK